MPLKHKILIISALLTVPAFPLFSNLSVTDTIDLEGVVVTSTKTEVPGLFVTERGITGFGMVTGAVGQLNMRGLGENPNTQVLILLDGYPQFMDIFPEGNNLLSQSDQINYGYPVPVINFMEGIHLRLSTY